MSSRALQYLFIPGPLPGMNELLAAKRQRRGRGQDAYGKLKRVWHDAVLAAVLQEKVRPMKSVKVSFGWLEPTRRRDPDNIAGGGQKLVLDGLVHAGVLENDGWQQVEAINHEFHHAPAKPGVIVSLDGEMR